jgi:hypothetical protein
LTRYPIQLQLSRRAIGTTWFPSSITMYLLQRRTTHRIAWPALLTFRPACFCLGRCSKVEDLPTILPLCTKRQTPLLPVFPKDDFPKLTKYLRGRYSFERESVPRRLSRKACNQATHSQTVRFACCRKGTISGAYLSGHSSMGQDPQGRTTISFDRNHASMPFEMSGLLRV